jgi:hypothetical protein
MNALLQDDAAQQRDMARTMLEIKPGSVYQYATVWLSTLPQCSVAGTIH